MNAAFERIGGQPGDLERRRFDDHALCPLLPLLFGNKHGRADRKVTVYLPGGIAVPVSSRPGIVPEVIGDPGVVGRGIQEGGAGHRCPCDGIGGGVDRGLFGTLQD